jgi:hypothetical protein
LKESFFVDAIFTASVSQRAKSIKRTPDAKHPMTHKDLDCLWPLSHEHGQRQIGIVVAHGILLFFHPKTVGARHFALAQTR